MPATAPYGTWISPLSARSVAAGGVQLSRVVLDGDDLYWLERRPDDAGRSVVVAQRPDGRIADVTPAGTNVRTRVHEYGGAAYTVSGGIVYFSEFADQRVYRLEPGGVPEPLTPPGRFCYADYTSDPVRRRLICVREDHTVPDREAVNTLVSLALDGSPAAATVIASGHDFYSSPCFNADGSRLAWLAWRHPDMPWDATELWIANVGADGRLGPPTLAAGGGGESIFQPGWSPDGTLYFVSDRTGWWNLHRLRAGQVEAVHPMAAEFGRPQWVFGSSTWAFAGESRIIAAYLEDGTWRVGEPRRHLWRTGPDRRRSGTWRQPGGHRHACGVRRQLAAGAGRSGTDHIGDRSGGDRSRRLDADDRSRVCLARRGVRVSDR